MPRPVRTTGPWCCRSSWSPRQLPSAGAGIRWPASAQYKVNVSIDVAVGRDGHAVYFSLGEAF